MNCPHCYKPIEVSLGVPPTAGGSVKTATRTTDPSDVDKVREFLGQIDEASCEDGKSADFVADMRAKLKQYGAKMFVTPKQLKFLQDVYNQQNGESRERNPW